MNATHRDHTSPCLLMAFELAAGSWKLAARAISSEGSTSRRIVRGAMTAGSQAGLEKFLRKARKAFGLDADCPVYSCYEAGRDGFWIHRWLLELGITNVVIDSSSIKVDRRAKRAKSDKLDAAALVREVERWYRGDDEAPSVVRVPGVDDEDLRQVDRELLSLKQDSTRCICRLTSLLAIQGIYLSATEARKRLDALRTQSGDRLPEFLHARLKREIERLELVEKQVEQVCKDRDALIRSGQTPAMQMVRQLTLLRGVAETSSWLFVMELFGWRKIRNRRELGAIAGLTPTPYDSGKRRREQGISKAGNRRVRTMAVQIAWSWLRWQPNSELSKWFRERFGDGGPIQRKIGIVAMARKLLVQLWRFLETGEVPAGAVLTACK